MGKIKMKTIKYLRKIQNYTTSQELPSTQKLDENLRLFGLLFFGFYVFKNLFFEILGTKTKHLGIGFLRFGFFFFFSFLLEKAFGNWF